MIKADNNVYASLSLTLSTLIGLIIIRSYKKEDRKIKQGNKILNNDTLYDVAIAGAGPAGSTAAYFLGKLGYRVALIDKKKFPRAKPCGDAWCQPALNLLKEMGILSKMENDGVCHPVTRGGFISPFGYECINTEGSKYGQVSGCKTYAIKRHIADEYLVKAAKDQETVRVFEGTEVVDAVYNESKNNDETGYYNLVIKDIDSDKIGSIYSSFVLICDGSTSYLGQKLGIIPKSQPAATCSHQYLSEHQWHDSDNQKAADGVMVFNRSVLPGYSALFRHYDSTVYLGTYILPGGRATSRAIPKFEDELTHEHSYVKNALGNSYKVHEKRIVAPIRCGGVPTSYAKQLFLVGDAAGHVDPLTGEGIHTAMIAGQIAAQCIDEMIKAGNFSMEAMKAYEKRCYDAFGYEFWSSSLCAKIIYNFPIVLDAVCVVGKRRGQSFLDFFGECMTGVRPKSDFVKDASLVAEVAMEMLKQIIIQYIISKKPLIPTKIGMEVVEKIYKSK